MILVYTRSEGAVSAADLLERCEGPDDVVWVDEDGHEMTTKKWALYLLNRQMTSTPKRTMTVHDVATGTWNDTAWASFGYTIDDGAHKRIGMSTFLFRKVGADWKVVLMHGSINAPAFPH